MSHDTGKELQLILDGNKKAFRRFYAKTKPKLKRYISSKVSNRLDIEELVQDAYLSFLDSLPLFLGNSSLETYLFSIARHEVADYWRKKYAKKAIQTVPFVNQVYTERLYSAAHTSQVIESVYERLRPHEVRILKWKYEEELPVKEIAKRLKTSFKAAESRLFRARQAFQLVYEEVAD